MPRRLELHLHCGASTGTTARVLTISKQQLPAPGLPDVAVEDVTIEEEARAADGGAVVKQHNLLRVTAAAQVRSNQPPCVLLLGLTAAPLQQHCSASLHLTT
jgi:hypothetical protein